MGSLTANHARYRHHFTAAITIQTVDEKRAADVTDRANLPDATPDDKHERSRNYGQDGAQPTIQVGHVFGNDQVHASVQDGKTNYCSYNFQVCLPASLQIIRRQSNDKETSYQKSQDASDWPGAAWTGHHCVSG